MKNTTLTLFIFFTISSSYAQKGFPKYYEYVALASKGDSLYKVKDYKNAALAYIAASKIQVEKGIEISQTDMYYNAACAYALGHKVNDAFSHLNYIVFSKNYSDFDRINSDSDFIFIHKDKRWPPLLSQIKSNKHKLDKKEIVYKQRTIFDSINSETIFYPFTDYAKQFIENDSFPFISLNHQNFRLFFSGNSYTAHHLTEVKNELTFAFSRVISMLNSANYNRGVNIILVDSPQELEELTGVFARGGRASIGNDLVFFVYNNDRRGQFKHELFHLIANQIWGNTQSRLLNEGSAVYADNQCFYDNPIYSIASSMIITKRALPLQALIGDFDNKARENEVIAYLQSAAVFKYLYEKYGIEKMKLLWIDGFNKFEMIYGMSVSQFEKEWIEFIRTIEPPKNIDWNNLLKNGCG